MYNISDDKSTLIINGVSFFVEDEEEDLIIVKPEYIEIMDTGFSVLDFPEELVIEINHETGFETYLFYELHISKVDNRIKLSFLCLQPNKYWESTWGLSTFLATLHDIVKSYSGIEVEDFDIEDDWKKIELSYSFETDFVLKNKVDECSSLLRDLIKQTELQLSGVVWRKEFEADESLFCTEILYPLLRKMSFVDVRYTHGKKEFGKDFTFSEPTKLGNLRHYGLQAKAGNVSGKVNSAMDELLGQLDDAFSMPYHEVSANETRRISTFIIAISGLFTENARDKIANKIPNHFKGSVYFLDRDKIQELIEHYWIRKV